MSAAMSKASYTVRRLRCRNCGWSQGLRDERIPVGREVKDHPCPSCGCKKLEKGL